MIWTVSDLMILLLTAALVINAAGGAALFLCRKLERVASMGELSGILKGIILYTAFGLPVMVGVAIFKFTFVGRSYVVSEDLEHGWIMRHVPFSIYSQSAWRRQPGRKRMRYLKSVWRKFLEASEKEESAYTGVILFHHPLYTAG